MQLINVMTRKKDQPLPENVKKRNDKKQKKPSDDIHTVVDRKVVPTRAPSQVEQDIPPGITTQK